MVPTITMIADLSVYSYKSLWMKDQMQLWYLTRSNTQYYDIGLVEEKEQRTDKDLQRRTREA